MAAGSSSKLTLRRLSGRGYLSWSEKIKKQLMSEGVWHLVERGYEKAQDMSNDATALSLVRQSLSPSVLSKICDLKTAKEAWDQLHHMYHQANYMLQTNESSYDGSDDRSSDHIREDDKCRISFAANNPHSYLEFPDEVGSLRPCSM